MYRYFRWNFPQSRFRRDDEARDEAQQVASRYPPKFRINFVELRGHPNFEKKIAKLWAGLMFRVACAKQRQRAHSQLSQRDGNVHADRIDLGAVWTDGSTGTLGFARFELRGSRNVSYARSPCTLALAPRARCRPMALRRSRVPVQRFSLTAAFLTRLSSGVRGGP